MDSLDLHVYVHTEFGQQPAVVFVYLSFVGNSDNAHLHLQLVRSITHNCVSTLHCPVIAVS